MSARRRRARRRVGRRGDGSAALRAVAAAAVLALVSACTSSPAEPAPETPSPSDSASTAPEPVTLRFSVYGGADELTAYRSMVRVYTRQNPHVTIRLETAPDAATAEARLEQTIAASAPDLFLTQATELPELMADRRVQPVDELLEAREVEFGDNYERLGLEAFAEDSALQCMPSDVSPLVVFYNERLLEATALAREPEDPDEPFDPSLGWTWEIFVEAARQMSVGGVKGVHLDSDLLTLTPLLRSAGTDVVDDPQDPTTLQLSSGPTRRALEQVLSLARDPALTPTPEELARADVMQRFEQGRLAMVIGTRDLVPRLRERGPMRFGVAPLPALTRQRTVADVSGFCISRGSTDVEAAADFLAFATGEEGGELLAASGTVVPANLAALHSTAFEQPGQQPRDADVFGDVMRRAGTMPDPPAWPLVVSRTQPLLDRLFTAPVLDLDTLLPRIDTISAGLLQPPPSPSASPSETPAS